MTAFGYFMPGFGGRGGYAPSRFNSLVYTGNGTSQSLDGLGFQPGFIIIRELSGAAVIGAFIADRGTGRYVQLNGSTGEVIDSGSTSVTSFDSDGFTVGDAGVVNSNALEYIALCWQIDDEIADHRQYNGNGSGGRTISHTVDTAPQWVMGLRASGGGPHYLYSADAGSSKTMSLAAGAFSSNRISSVNASTFTTTLGTDGSGDDWSTLLWGEDTEESSFGAYTGNASASGPTVDCGFFPKLVMIKSVASGDIICIDRIRAGENPSTSYFPLASTGAEVSLTGIQFTGSGFQIKTSNDTLNKSGQAFVYAAWR